MKIFYDSIGLLVVGYSEIGYMFYGNVKFYIFYMVILKIILHTLFIFFNIQIPEDILFLLPILIV